MTSEFGRPGSGSAPQLLFRRLHDLNMVMVQQVASRVIDLSNGKLKIDLSLDQIQLRLCELSLRV